MVLNIFILKTHLLLVKGVRGKHIKNNGTLPTVLIENNHPTIVSKEIWMKANEKLKAKALEYQNTSKYSGNRDGKLCFNKVSIPASICVANAVKTIISR